VAVPWITAEIADVVFHRRFPAITYWNRLEGRPRADDFTRALKAEVRDALWMLTRQWQLGEFHGDDAGSPVFAKVVLSTTRLEKYRADAHTVVPFDDNTPLEAHVEARPVPLELGGRDVALDLRLLAGRQWLKLMASIGDFSAAFRNAYPIHVPDPSDPNDAVYTAHPEAWSAFRLAGRRMDGVKLYRNLVEGGHAWDGIPALDPHRGEVDDLAERFVRWFERLIHQPGEEDAWLPDRLEYQFACAAPDRDGEKVLVAEEYALGHLDWYALDADTSQAQLGETPATGTPGTSKQVVLPAAIGFEGMPNTRWWTFEDGRTNFGDVRPDTTDVGKLLLLEFALVYANDWYLIPYTLPAGSIARVRGLAVTNVFGERTWVEAAARGDDADSERWAMFQVSIAGDAHVSADTSLLLLPTAVSVLEGRPLEEVLLIRDEVANMVWGVERTIALPSGQSKPGQEAGRELLAELQRRAGPPPPPPPPAGEAKVRYEVMTTVPEYWIPFIPVHVEGDDRQIQLQRAAMPRVIGNAVSRVEPRTALLREGLDADERYFLHEEEVPRAGAHVVQTFQRTRWRDGRAWVWLGARKQTGRGEASSGLAFDQLTDLPDA
jgi:hypothetical protein